MSRAQRQRGDSRWQEVLNLGEALLSQAGAQPPGPDVLQTQRSRVAETAARLLSAHADLWLDAGMLLEEGQPLPEHLFSPQPPTELMRCALQERKICCGPGGAAPAIAPDSPLADATALAVPLLSDDPETRSRLVLGVLSVERPQGPAFTSEEVELFQRIVFQAAVAFRDQRQAVVEQWRVQQLSLVRQVSQQIIHLHDLDELARQVTRLILETFNYYYVAIFTLEPGQELLQFRASAGPLRRLAPGSSGEASPPVLSARLGEGLIGMVAQTGEEILASDVSREPRYRYSDALPETRSEATLPILIESRVLGVLDVQSDAVDDFRETDLLVLRALAGNIALAVEEIRLSGTLRRRAEHLSAIAEVSRAIVSILDPEKLLDEVVHLVQKRFGYRYVHVFDVHPGRRKVFFQASSDPRGRELREAGFAYGLDDPEGIIPWVAREGKTIVANDVEAEPRYRPSVLPPELTRSELAVPLLFGDEVLGVLDVQSDHTGAFGPDDRFLFEALADTVAVAMRNAVLYRSERWRRQVADSLREVAGLLSADMDLDQVLDAILTELERNLPCDVAAIWLLESDGDGGPPGDDQPALDGAEPPLLRLAASHGLESAGANLAKGLRLDEWITNGGASGGGEALPAAAWLGEALDADQPVVRSPHASVDPWGAALGFPTDYSAIAAPLRAGGQRLGVLTLAHATPNRYGSQARGMAAAFASSAAVAIENARLYEAAHEQAWVSTVLLQVAEATQSLTNLNELLATVVRITPMLVGVKACVLYLLEESGVFVPAAASGLSPAQQVEFERWRFAPGEVSALDQLRSEKHPIVVRNAPHDSRLEGVLFTGADSKAPFGAELLVMVPLMAHGEVLGAFLIDYSDSQPGNENLEALFDEPLAILQGIAHQTAIAVENIRLVKSQKEEAYVSVALLQVAQAVVSSNDLDETLGAIVRITPILVGVKRTVIYLWDAQRGVFRMAQSYGLSRGVAGRLYAPGEFPLLDAVKDRNSLAAIPLGQENTASTTTLEAWNNLIPADPETTAAYLDGNQSLLLGLPLAVKGTVLGVLLVEEPEAPGGGLTDEGAARRLREKRLEITTGISQQAALAIQNDELQRQMVERGRLEREFQLAREIQRTFLPSRPPQLANWEVNARWRTAREVGGDFYDFFDLPGNRLGLVIADVADKGMPAALFMTLIRTLIRASVLELESPAAVLRRVNDLLAPDAQGGMFVTVFYGVVSLATGELAYANAGHNPPLIVRLRESLAARLPRTGMALGIAEGVELEERSEMLEGGDFLVLYTDGVTEAFSPEGEMFGEGRLINLVLEADADSTLDMVDTIDDAVSDFIGDNFLSDDVTLVVLRRSRA